MRVPRHQRNAARPTGVCQRVLDCHGRSARRAVVTGMLAAAGLAATAHASPPPLPGPAPRGHHDAAELNAECESCHRDIAAEWRESQHRAAFRDPSFVRAFLREPLPFCQGCHAPEGDPSRRPTRAVADMGVACVTCHVVNGQVLAAPVRLNVPPSAGPHQVVRSAAFGGEGACAACHEFPFPDGRAAMQSTVSEHRLSPAASTACAGCHMPLARGAEGARPHRSHGFAASHDLVRLRSAMDVSATRSKSVVHLTLTPRVIGHAFPTGDLFRRVAVYVTAGGSEVIGRPLAARFLTRHFEPKPNASGALVRTQTADDRVGASGSAPSEIEFNLDQDAATKTVSYRVTYERVQHFTSTNERDAVITEAVTLFSGELEP